MKSSYTIEELNAFNLNETMKKTLLGICQDFIRDNNITCAETVYQSDRVIENAYEFIDKICSLVGYAKEEEEED